MYNVNVFLVLAAGALMAAEARLPQTEDISAPGVFSVEESAPYPFAPEALEPTLPVEKQDEAVDVPLPPRVVRKRSTTVFRPLFATRERDAERQEARERRREYWQREEQRRRSAQVQRQQPYPGQYRPYPAGAYPGAYPAGRNGVAF
ncbi:MAP-homologous protein 1 [Frankliniella fusca]|uniref:MAP-homologous protein 1 n=1 Tax=Frankliniella fusca TaxID=407009 RepID=A0AAE1LPI9_9NEOP|nr:MAP-homologous protein 1 [Frankliniella fusca]